MRRLSGTRADSRMPRMERTQAFVPAPQITMPLPKSVLCSTCKKTYPEGWRRCPYCGFSEVSHKQDAQARRFMQQKLREWEQRTGQPRDDRQRPAERGERRQKQGSGRDKDQRQQPRAQQQQNRGQQQPPPQQQPLSAEGQRTGRRRRRRRGGGGGGEAAQGVTGPNPQAPQQQKQNQPQRPQRPQQPQQQRPPRDQNASSAPREEAKRDADAAPQREGAEGTKRRRRFRRRRGGGGGEGGAPKPPASQ
jgi:hypothetical protein